MDAQFWLFFLVPWMLIGLATGWFMGKRGHHGLSWMVLGVAFGPLLIPAAVGARNDANRKAAETVARGRAGIGTIDVLIGIDGSPAARAAARTVGAVLGERLGQVSLAIVVDHDTAWNTAGVDHGRAVQRLREAASELPASIAPPDLVVLGGIPAQALVDHARATDVELVVVGTRGAGLAKTVLGSVAEDLSRRSEVPVLLVPTPVDIRIPDSPRTATNA